MGEYLLLFAVTLIWGVPRYLLPLMSAYAKLHHLLPRFEQYPDLLRVSALRQQNPANFILPLRGVLRNALQERLLVLHHDGTPKSNISSNGSGDSSQHKCSRSFLDVSVGLGEQGNDVEVGSCLLAKRYYGGEGCERLHLEDV